MYIRVTYDQDFEDLWMHLKSKYPSKLFDIDGVGNQLDLALFSKNFFSSRDTTADKSIDANSNVDDISVVTYQTELPKPFFRLNSYFVLWKYAKKLFDHETANRMVESCLIGDIYPNDFHGVGSGLCYCFNYDTYDIMCSGLPYIHKIISIPPKHLWSFKSQLEQFITYASNNTLGACGIANLWIIASYYAKRLFNEDNIFRDEECIWKFIKEEIQSLIYTVNQPFRSNQSPFTNCSVYDKYFLEELCKDYVFPDGSMPDGNLVMKIQELYLQIMNEELCRTPVTFPITTACFSIDENNNIKDHEFKKMIAKYNKNYGFINIYNGNTSTLSSCCRLRSNTENEYFNNFGAGSSKIGSMGVKTINIPRIACKNKGDIDGFFKELEEKAELAQKMNHVKRYIIKMRIANGNLPLFTYGFADIKKQYSTLGVVGLNEACYFMGYDILNKDGQNFVKEIQNRLNKINNKCEQRYKYPHNNEQVPAENSSIKLADKDKLLKYQNEFNVYSNQFIPLTTKADMLDRIKLQGMFDSGFSGGAICHINVEERIEDESRIEDLIVECAKKGIVYWAINHNLQMCGNGHMTVGKNETCSICGNDIINNYTRVVGFLTNTKNWHKVRREEDYPNRQWYKEI